VKKKTLLKVALISVFLLSAVAGTRVVNLARANPYSQADYKGEIAPPSYPKITITSPQNNINCYVNSLSIILNVSIKKAQAPNYYQWISRVYYELGWLRGDEDIYISYYGDPPNRYSRPPITEFYYCLNLTETPEGKHNVTFHAIEGGNYYESLFAYYSFSANASSVFSFTVDTTPPVVSVSDVENKTYDVSDVPLSFTVNESTSKISYVLDGQNSVTIAGNTTLTGLSEGEHNVKVCATDNAGNTGASEAITFNVNIPKPFPNDLVIVAGASVGFISFWLIVFSVVFGRRTEKS
jgi:hypothetical protein